MSKKCKLMITDEVNAKFVGLDAKTRRKMQNALRFFVPYAPHIPAFKLGRWDGYVSFCSIGGSTQINLLDKVLPIVIEDGYDVDIDDNRPNYKFDFPMVDEEYWADLGKVWPEGHRFEGQPILLRDDQADAINLCFDNLQSISELATSYGKTVVCATLSHLVEPCGKSIVIVPSKSLVKQTEEDYLNLGLDVGVYFGPKKEIGKTHTICTWQSLESLVKKGKGLREEDKPINQMIDGVIAVIVDEVHSAKANILKDLLTGPFANVPIRWGFTGTVPKEEYEFLSIYGSIGPVVNRVTAKELQDKGIVSECHVNVVQMIDTVELKNYHEEHEYLVTDKNRLAWMADFIAKVSKTGNTLVLVDRIECGNILESFIPDSVFISGDTKLTERKEQYDQFKDLDNKILIASYGIASTGINLPRIFNLVLIEPGKSFVRVIQSIGRGIRKAEDKDFVQIYDFASTCKFSKRHLQKRRIIYKEAQYPNEVNKIDWQKY